jgi:ABC-type dipeptide/oligopeptide/nickel transport system permease subunit
MLGKLPWMQLAAPAAALSLFAAAFYMVSRGLHDIAEPRLRK